jgi:MinD-like ATPase involved in chromosome partitioning or flagellar assembly
MLIVVLSLKGSPGVTTFSVALAARWPAPARALLVEADPSGGDIATRFSLASAPGLVSLAAAARRSTEPGLVWQHAQALPGGLPVVAAPPDTDRARAALSALTPDTGVSILRAVADRLEAAVIVDCGRIDPGTPAMPIVRAADVLVLLSRAHADDLAHLVLRLPAVGRWCRRPVLLLVGDGYPTADVARELGVPPLGRIPNDPRGAAVLCGRPSQLRRGGPSHSALGRFAHKVAQVLVSPPMPTAPPAPTRASHPVPVLQAVPGVPDRPVATGGVRLAPSPSSAPVNDASPRGGEAS